MSKITNFSDSFFEERPLPRNGTPCNHARHFHNCARVVVKRMEYLASLRKDRFVYAYQSDFQKKCRDWETKEPYNIRMIKAVFAFVRDLGMIEYTTRQVNGIKRKGFVVVPHADITKILENSCIWCDEAERESRAKQKATSPETSLRTSPKTSPETSPDNAFGLHGETSPEIASANASEVEVKIEDVEQWLGVLHGVLHGVSQAPNSESTVNIGNIESCAECSQITEADKAKATQNLVRLFDNRTRTTLTVGSWLKDEPDLEVLLDRLTDGVMETGSLIKYDHVDTFGTVCRNTIRSFSETPIVDRTTCAQIMERINTAVRRKGINPPRAWLPVMKELKQGGAIRMKQTNQWHSFDDHSVWEAVTDKRGDGYSELRVYAPLIDMAEHSMDLQAGSWSEVATVLTYISDRLRSANHHVPELFATVIAEMIRRTPDVEVVK
jgi:hypothetical protein